MERNPIPTDDFIGNLIRESEPESLSADFEVMVMEQIRQLPEPVVQRKRIYQYIRASLPYFALFLLVVIILLTSDLPFLNWFPGKIYLYSVVMPFFNQIISGLRPVFSSNYFSFGMMIIISGGLLFLLEMILSRWSFFHRNPMAGK